MLFPYNFFKKLCIAQSERLVSPSLGPGSAVGEFFLVISCNIFTQGAVNYIWSKGEKQQQTQPLHGVDARIRTRAALVGEEFSHHYRTTLAPLTGSCVAPLTKGGGGVGGRGEVNPFSRSLSQTTARLGSLGIFLFCLFLPVLSLVPS